MKNTCLCLFGAMIMLMACSTNEPTGRGNNITPPPTSALDKSNGALNGAFSVAEGKYVHFAMGNLQYTQSSDTWAFAQEQYEVVGERNMVEDTIWLSNNRYSTNYSLADTIDLFAWGTGNNPTLCGDESFLYTTFTDWGTNVIDNGGNQPNQWRTLTFGEWGYIIKKRPNATELYGVAVVNGVNGLILLPDAWECPKGIGFKSGCVPEGIGHDNRTQYEYQQSFTEEEWRQLENAGAVFLPAAGERTYKSSPSYHVHGTFRLLGEVGKYWHSSKQSYDNTYSFGFYCYTVGTAFYGSRCEGHSVRLVQDIE